MADAKYKILIHGAGWVSTQHIDAFGKHPLCQVIAISSRTLAGARKRAEEEGLKDVGLYDDYRKALDHEGVNVVAVCTPQHLHCDNVVAAAEAGKHIVIEKPVATSLEELQLMRHAVRESGVKTVVSFVLRWNPLFLTLKRMISEGDLGELYGVETDYQSYLGDWWGGWEDGRQSKWGVSATLVGGCHAVDALRWFAAPGEFEAAQAVEVFAWEGGRRAGSTVQYDPHNHSWHQGTALEYPGFEMALVKFSNGVLGKVSTNFECIHPYAFPLEIFGDKGSIKNNRVWSHRYPQQKDWVEIQEICPDSSDVTHHPFQAQIDHFVDCLENDVESHCSLDDAVRTHEIVFAMQECYRSGRPVKLPLLEA